MSSQKKKGMNLERKQNFTGWVFLLPATILIAWMSFYPMIQAFILSLQTGMGINLKFNGFANYARILKDPTFKQTLSNTFLYLIIQVPIMLILGLMFASMLNNKDLRFKGLFRTCIFLPCATSLVSYAMISVPCLQTMDLSTPFCVDLACIRSCGSPMPGQPVPLSSSHWSGDGRDTIWYSTSPVCRTLNTQSTKQQKLTAQARCRPSSRSPFRC